MICLLIGDDKFVVIRSLLISVFGVWGMPKMILEKKLKRIRELVKFLALYVVVEFVEAYCEPRDSAEPRRRGAGLERGSGASASPPEPAPSAPPHHQRPYSHPYFQSDSSSEPRSSEEEEFGEYDGACAVPTLNSPDSPVATAPRRNPSPYYYADLFRPSAPPAPQRYRKSASLDAPHVAPRVRLPKRFSVTEDGLCRELERSSSSSSDRERMPPRRPAQDAPACVCAAREDADVDELFHPSRSVFYVPAPRWPRDMAGRRLYETAFDCKVSRSDDDLDDFDRVSNHPALMQAADRAAASSSSSAVDTQDMRRNKLSGRSDSSRRSKQPINRQQQLENDSNASMISEEMENMHLTSGDDQQNSTTSQLPLRGYTPSPPSTAPLPTKFQQSKDYLAMNSIKSAPNLPSQPAHPRLKDLRLPVKSLRARETPMSSDVSIVEITGRADATSSDFELGNRLRNMIQDSQDRISESKGRPRLNNGLFLEIKGRPISDSDTPNMNRFRGSKESGPILEFKGRPRRHIRHKYSSTESMATSSSGGSMESIRSSTSEGNRSTSSSESRHSSTISSHSSDSSNNTGFPKMHHGLPLSGFISHHANKLHILSPISDKSSQEPASETSDNNKNNNSQKVSPDENGDTANCGNQTHIEVNVITKPKRRIPQNRNLLNLAFQHSMTGDTEIQGSDSGISIHSRDGVNSRNAFLGFLKQNQSQSNNGPNNIESNNCTQNDFSDLPFDMPKLRRRRAANQNEVISGSTTSVDLRNLPFDMPKLRRKLRGQTMQFNDMESSGVSQASSSQSVQELEQGKPRPKLTLNFEGKASGRESFSSGSGARSLNLNFSGLTAAPPASDTFDSSLPLERQGWYHGAISRIEAESILRVASEGAFLVRNSESTKQDYSLSLKSARGFMHMRIQRSDDTGQYILGQFSKPFPSIPDMIRHYCANRLPVRGAEHMCLVKPLIAQLL